MTDIALRPPQQDPRPRILIVDDDEAHAEAVAESLERVGYDCVVASSGQRAVQLIEGQVLVAQVFTG